MKYTQQILLLMAITLMSINGLAQKKVDFPKDVNLIKMTDAGIAIVGTDDALYGVDKNGNQLWKNEKLRKVEANRVEILSGSELIFVSDKGLGRNRVLNVLDGHELANPGKNSAGIHAARVIHGTNQIWVVNDARFGNVNVWDIDSNTLLYEFDLSDRAFELGELANYTGTFASCQPITYTSESSALIHVALGQLGEYDLNSGKAMWTFDFKPYKIKKDEDIASTVGKRFTVMKLDEVNNTLYFPFRDRLISINAKTGAPNWGPKSGKTGKVLDMYILDEGVLILTMKGLYLIDKSTGESLWDKPIKIKNAAMSILLEDGDDFFAISKNTVIDVDVKNRTSKALTEKIKFQGGETFNSLSIYDNVLVLGSAQNAVGIDKHTGEITHSTYYKEPGMGIAEIAANVALAAVAAAATMNSYNVNSANARGGSFTYHQYTPAMYERKHGGSGTVTSNNISYMSTKFNDADAKGFGVARVDVKTGETTDKIVIGSREPVYAVDENDRLIYFKSGKSSVEIKSIN